MASNCSYRPAVSCSVGLSEFSRHVIQPTRTIIHNPNGTTTVIVQRRSYLDPGTEVPVGYGSHFDYAFPPGGDPGRPHWFYGLNKAMSAACPWRCVAMH